MYLLWLVEMAIAVDHFDGLFLAGSERPARDGVHLAPAEGEDHGHKRRPASVNTNILCEIPNDVQSGTISFGNPQLPIHRSERRSVDPSAAETREQRQVILNFGGGPVPFGSLGLCGWLVK
jgi:hypothetical protein